MITGTGSVSAFFWRESSYGIAGGLLIALFRFLLGLADTYRRRLFQEIIIPSFGISDFLPLLWWLAVLFFIGGVLYGMCRYAPMASGSGIPQVKGVILGFGLNSYRLAMEALKDY